MKYFVYTNLGMYNEANYTCPIAGESKAKYVISVLNRIGIGVLVVNPGWTRNATGTYKGIQKQIRDDLSIICFHSFAVSKRALRPLQWLCAWNNVIRWSFKNIKRNEVVIVYHSLYSIIPILISHKLIKYKLILEVEERYQDVIHTPSIVSKLEDRMIMSADSYILSTVQLRKYVRKDRPFVVINGNFLPDGGSDKREVKDSLIHCLYSGTFDERKGGAEYAIRSAFFLPTNYVVHISGFGKESQIEKVVSLINEINKNTKCHIIYEGMLEEKAYKELLTLCSIGLNTQIPDEKFSNTCFPSKVLMYLSYGLYVVSSDNIVMKESSVGSMVYYYNRQDPKTIAETIMRINPFDSVYNPRERLKLIDKNMCEELKQLICNTAQA